MNQAKKFINKLFTRNIIVNSAFNEQDLLLTKPRKFEKQIQKEFDKKVITRILSDGYQFADNSRIKILDNTVIQYDIPNKEIQCMITEECFIPFSQMQSIRAGLRKTLSDINKRRMELERDIKVFYARAEDDGTAEGRQYFTLLNDARAELETIKKAESNNIILTKMVKACMMDASRSHYII